jgi:hypothetical protein
MAALSKRDIEMIFRAETDAAQRPVKDLVADVKKLRTGMEDLAKSSDKTDKSLHDLAATTRELEKAQQELANARTLVTQLNAQESALERVQSKADASVKKYRDLQTAMEGVEKPTKRQTQQLEAAERAMNANSAKLDQAKRDYAEVKTSIESIIGPVENAGVAFRDIAVAQREITQGLNNAKGAAGEFKKEIAEAADAAKRLKADDIQIDTRTTVAQDRNAGLADAANRQRQRDQLEELVRSSAALDKQFQDLERSEQRLAQVNAFRALAADSVAAVSATERIAATTNNASTSAQRLAMAIQGILDPAGRAAQTIQGIEATIQAADAKLATGRLSAASWGELNNSLASVQGNLVKIASDLDRFTAQESRVTAGAAAFEAQRAKVEALRNAVVTADTDVVKLTADLAREESTLRSLGGALDAETLKLKALGDTLKAAGVNTQNIPAEIERITKAANAAAPSLERVRTQLGGGPGGRGGFLGLDPFALQNLSYQVNDVFTSLASGIPPFQVLAQQGGQIIQLFPGVLGRLAAFLPVIVPLAAGIFVLASAFGEMKEQAVLAREAAGVLDSLGETNGNTAKDIKETTDLLRGMGVEARVAQEAVLELAKRGLDPRALDDYAIAAKNLADVNGVDLKVATDEVAKAFTTGAEAVLTLDDKYHFLTDTQRDNLKASKDTKNEYNEVNKAFTQLYNKMQDGANAMRGPYTDATNTLKNSWHGLLETIADTGVLTTFSNKLNDIIVGFSYMINLGRRAAAVFKDYKKGNEIDAIKSLYNNFNSAGGINGILQGAQNDTFAQMRSARAALNREQGFKGDAGAGSRGRQVREEKRDEAARKQAAIDAKKAARDAEAEAKRRAAEAKQLERQYQNEQDQLSQSLSRYTVEAMKGTQAPLEAQLDLAKKTVDEQFKAVEDRLSEFREKFGAGKLINGMTQADYSANLDTQKAAITQARQLGVYESNVNDLLKSRSERLKGIQDDQKTGLLSAQEALDKTREVTSDIGPKLDAAIFSARTFIASLTPSNETQALLDKFDRVRSQNGDDIESGTIQRGAAKTGLANEEQKLNDIFARRASLISAANKLYDLGVTTFNEKEASVKQAYTDTDAALRAQIETMRVFLDTNQALFAPEVYAAAKAQLAEYNAQLQYTDTMTQQVKGTAEQAISGGLMNMFDTLSQGLANVITGAGSLKDLFSDLGNAALQFAADFLKSIAQAIAQIYALQIAKAAVGAFHGGGTVGDYSSGQMRVSRNIGLPSLAAVPRYHQGTQGAGLKSNEMLAVLEKGEKVQTDEQQRAAKRQLDNARKGGQGSLRQVLAFGDDQVAAAMVGEAGENVTLTHLRRNVDLVKQWLRG